ncbi:MAG: hypothetical protein K6F84_06775, partial [Lachnospiraceae bacterium]|nr:hypothetical protein [Lachnospiraceae bacterium]
MGKRRACELIKCLYFQIGLLPLAACVYFGLSSIFKEKPTYYLWWLCLFPVTVFVRFLKYKINRFYLYFLITVTPVVLGFVTSFHQNALNFSLRAGLVLIFTAGIYNRLKRKEDDEPVSVIAIFIASFSLFYASAKMGLKGYELVFYIPVIICVVIYVFLLFMQRYTGFVKNNSISCANIPEDSIFISGVSFILFMGVLLTLLFTAVLYRDKPAVISNGLKSLMLSVMGFIYRLLTRGNSWQTVTEEQSFSNTVSSFSDMMQVKDVNPVMKFIMDFLEKAVIAGAYLLIAYLL